MKTQVQARRDDRDNGRILRWLVIAFVVLVVGALGYNLLAHNRMGELPGSTATTQSTPQAPAVTNGK